MRIDNIYIESLTADSKTRAMVQKEVKKLAKQFGYSEKQVRKYLYHSQRSKENETGINQQAGEGFTGNVSSIGENLPTWFLVEYLKIEKEIEIQKCYMQIEGE